MSKDLGSFVLAGAVVLAAVLFATNYEPTQVNVTSSDGEVRVIETKADTSVGSIPGNEVFSLFKMSGGAELGGGVVSTSTLNTAETLLASDLFNVRQNRYTTRLEVTPNAGDLTLTLPATSTMEHLIPNDGDTFSVLIENEATAATTTTIAAGTGMDLQEPDGQNVVIGQNNFAWLTFQRDEDSDMIVRVDETIPADN